MAIDQKPEPEKLTTAAAAEGRFATIHGQTAERPAKLEHQCRCRQPASTFGRTVD